ncbi:hypothetical protein [Microvirga aerophila]|uniref:Uncharacterized protein n=1 Tax=Microvirga aerophila TaxID=670291 RepID=A0A512C2G4_9HYPH|nr:hypothetical protein [Microvirga aerophila]GEO18405.1 hypothetical protein MAE02_61010 [Microvirga aerophila]
MRLGKLEAIASAAKGARSWHRIIAHSQEADAKQAALVASGGACEGDNFIYRIITGVPRSSHGVAQ